MRINERVALAALCTFVGLDQRALSADSPVSDNVIAEIVVTAQRKSENLQDVPIAITAVAGSDLTRSGVDSTLDLPTMTPGLTMPATSGYVTPHIRGVGTAAFGAGLENSVAVYVDGVYYVTAPSSLFMLNNIAQVAVLKGPQGTLFGRNATGGLIQITTDDPTADWHGHAAVGYGDYQTFTGNGYLSGGLNDHVAADVSFVYMNQGQGFGRNFFNAGQVNRDDLDYALRSKWLITFDENTHLRLSGDFSRAVGNQLQSNHTAPGSVPTFGLPNPGSPWDVDADLQPYNDFKGYGVSATLDHDFSSFRVVNIAAYRKSQFLLGFDADLTPLPIETISPLQDNEHQFSEELLVSGSDRRVSWVGGVYFLSAVGGYHPSQVLLGGPLEIPLGPPPAPSLTSIANNGDIDTTSISGYGQGTLKVADATHLTVGLRYTYERRELDAEQVGFAGVIPLGPLGPPVDESRRYYKPTWRLSLDHRFDSDHLGYISYNRGFKSGGFNVGVPSDAPFAPEVLDAYEIGMKMDLADHRVRLNPSVYYYDYSNIQVAHFVLGQVGYYNGARASVYGLDLEGEAQLTAALAVRAGLELTHTRFLDFPNALFYTPLATGGADVRTASAAGHELPYSPKATLSVAADYAIRLPLGAAALNVTYYYNNGWFSSPDNILRQPAYNLLNSSVEWSAPEDRWAIKLWARNLTNAAVASALNASAISSLAEYQPPRTYGVTISARL